MDGLGELYSKGRGAQITEEAVGAVGIAGQADTSSMENEQMTEDSPAVVRNEEHKILLNFVGMALVGECEPA